MRDDGKLSSRSYEARGPRDGLTSIEFDISEAMRVRLVEAERVALYVV